MFRVLQALRFLPGAPAPGVQVGQTRARPPSGRVERTEEHIKSTDERYKNNSISKCTKCYDERSKYTERQPPVTPSAPTSAVTSAPSPSVPGIQGTPSTPSTPRTSTPSTLSVPSTLSPGVQGTSRAPSEQSAPRGRSGTPGGAPTTSAPSTIPRLQVHQVLLALHVHLL